MHADRRGPDVQLPGEGGLSVRTMFVVYLTVIVVGLAFFLFTALRHA